MYLDDDALEEFYERLRAHEREYGPIIHDADDRDAFAPDVREFLTWADGTPATRTYPVRRLDNRLTVAWDTTSGETSAAMYPGIERAGLVHLSLGERAHVISGTSYDPRDRSELSIERFWAAPRGVPLAPRLDDLLTRLIFPTLH